MEIAERRGEKLQVLGPVVEGVENELADDIRRAVIIMNRRGLLPPKPQSLLGVPLEIEFDSMIRVAQRAAETAVMERSLTVVTNLTKVVPQEHPEDEINIGRTVRKYLDLTQFPVDCMNGEQDVQKIKAARMKAQQDAQQQQAQAQMMTHTAPAMAGAAKTASEIDTGGALNALQIMSGFGGAAPGATGLPQ